MNKSQLIEAVAKDLALPKNEVKRIVESLFKISVDKLRGGEKVVISGFGVFSVAMSAARIGRNPRTGAAVKISPRRTVRFRSRIDLDSGGEPLGDEEALAEELL